MSTTFNEAKDVIRDEFGRDHNSAKVRHKTKTNKNGDNNYDRRVTYSHGEDQFDLSMTEEGGTVYVRASGHDGRGWVFCTFTAENRSMDEVVDFMESELGISMQER